MKINQQLYIYFFSGVYEQKSLHRPRVKVTINKTSKRPEGSYEFWISQYLYMIAHLDIFRLSVNFYLKISGS